MKFIHTLKDQINKKRGKDTVELTTDADDIPRNLRTTEQDKRYIQVAQ